MFQHWLEIGLDYFWLIHLIPRQLDLTCPATLVGDNCTLVVSSLSLLALKANSVQWQLTQLV